MVILLHTKPYLPAWKPICRYYYIGNYSNITWAWSCIKSLANWPFPVNWCSQSITVCFTCAWNVVFEWKINCCIDGVHMVCYSCISLCFICVSVEFTLGSCVFTLSLHCYRAHSELKMVSTQHIVNTKKSWHTPAPNCCVFQKLIQPNNNNENIKVLPYRTLSRKSKKDEKWIITTAWHGSAFRITDPLGW